MIKQIVLLLVAIFTITSASEKKMVAYYNLVREVSDAQHIPYEKLTHINIENITVDTEGNLYLTGQDWAKSLLETVIDTIMKRSKEHDVKVSIVVGYTKETQEYINDSTQRSDFAKKIVTYCMDNNYDGIDLDFEGEFDEISYELFAKEIRELLPSEKLLTAAVSADTGSYLNPKAWTDKMLSYCDWVNVMIYCLRGTWSSSPVGSPANYEDFIMYASRWLNRLPKEKLVLGIPTFSATFVDPDTSWILNNTNYGVQRIWGTDSWCSNSIDYRHIIKYFPEELRSDTVAGDFYLTLADIGLTTDDKLKEFNKEVCFDYTNKHPLKPTDMLGKTFFTGPELTKRKAAWAAENGFAGLMFNHLHEDITAHCSYIDAQKVDSLSIIRTGINTFNAHVSIVNKQDSSPQDNSLQISILDNTLYCSRAFKSVELLTLSGKKLTTVPNNFNKKSLQLPKELASKVYIARIKGVDNSITVTTIGLK